ncbi:hypothetical protein [Streptomyces sp. NPDC002088]|uniref:hypothetical protein n=1 Tax=unclassified Streptomyces TaxID=2593676 RepID=UPI0033285573
MLATSGSTVQELRDLILLATWLLPATAALCAVFFVSFVTGARRHRAAGEVAAAAYKVRSAAATGALVLFLCGGWVTLLLLR